MEKLQINKEFKELIPPLTEDEYDLLEQNILEEGIRDPIIVYENMIVDGHNRFEIAQKHDVEFTIVDKKFDSIDAVKIWIIENQLGRRNVSDFAKYELLEIKELSNLIKIGKIKRVRKSKDSVLSTVSKTNDSHNTREIIAKALGWSPGKVGMAKIVKQKSDKKTLQELREGKITINGVYKKIKMPKKHDSNVDVQHDDNVKKIKKYNMVSISSESELAAQIYMEKTNVSNKDKVIDILVSIGIYNFLKERNEI